MALALRELNPAQGVSERHLVSAVRRGDDRAFELLFERYRRRIASYVYGLLRDAGRAEDITQEIFIAALRRLRATERPIAFKPWIYEIAKNACIDEFRRTSRAAVVSLDDEADNAATAAPLVDDISPDIAWERREQFDHLVAAFSGLSSVHHRMLVMRELEGLSYVEIGDRLGMSRTMVESTLFRARRRLTSEYEELTSGRQCERVQSALDGLAVRVARSPGIRERRRISAHLRHCHTCVRHAREAGVEESLLRAPSVTERIAAILPVGSLPAILRRFAARHGSAAASSTALADAPPAVAVSRAIAAVAALAVAGVALPEVSSATHHGSGTAGHAITVPASLSLGPVPTQVALPLNAAAAQGAEPLRTLPVAVLANLDAFRAALAREARGAASSHSRASAGGSTAGAHHGGARHGGAGTKGTRAGSSAAPGAGGAPGSTASTGSNAGVAGGGGRHPLAPATNRIRSGSSGLVGTVRSATKALVGSSTIAAAGSTVGQVGAATGSTVTQTAAAAGNAVTQTGAVVGNTVSQPTGAVSGQVGQAVGAAVSSTSAAAGAAVAGTGAAVGAVVSQTGQVAGAATSLLTKH